MVKWEVLALRHAEVWGMCAELAATLHEHHFTWKNDRQTVVIQHFLWNEESLLYTENNWQYLLPMITFHLSNEN